MSEVELEWKDRVGKLVVDGVDLSMIVGMEMRLEVDEYRWPTLYVDFPGMNPITFKGEATVAPDAETAAALIHLGWTPPPDDNHKEN